jgi:ribosomal-protein-alanine N-acetyltransferase
MNLVPIPRDGDVAAQQIALSEVAMSVIAPTVQVYGRCGYVEPWIGYLAAELGDWVGCCGFTSPPLGGIVEIAYFTFPGFEGRGIATGMAQRLIKIAEESDPSVRIIAHTLAEENASNYILKKLGFVFAGAVDHPEDGNIWEWRYEPNGPNQRLRPNGGPQRITLMVLAVLLISIIGCASGPQFRAVSSPPSDAALVYIYRLKHYNAWAGLIPNATSYRISIAGERIVDLSNGGYYPFIARSTTNTLGSAMNYRGAWILAMALDRKELLRTEFEPGKTYYLKFEVGTFGPKMTDVGGTVGESEVKQCRLIAETK